MKSQVTEDFVACFSQLPEKTREQARRCYRLWKSDPYHRSLQFKRIHSQEEMYSARVGRGYRVLGLLEGNTITWFWIGSHAEYDRLIRYL